MSNNKNKANRHRLSLYEKNKDDKQWYKDQCNYFDSESKIYHYEGGVITENKRLKVNYDLYDGKLDSEYFDYLCGKVQNKKLSDRIKKQIRNKDIISSKINLLLGMEIKKPFSYKLMATNKEATTQREKKEFELLKNYIIQQIVQPIQEQVAKKYEEQLANVTPEQQSDPAFQEQMAQMEQQMQQEIEAMTPEEVGKYMARKYQTPAEMLHSQLLNYSIKKFNIKDKFNTSFKDLLVAGGEYFYVGVLNGEPVCFNLDPKRISYDRNKQDEFIEDREWATYRYSMTPSQIIRYFGDQLKDKELDLIYEKYGKFGTGKESDEDIFYIIDKLNDSGDIEEIKDNNNINVIHTVWKSLRKLGFLTYINEETGQEDKMLIDESYKINKEDFDIEIEWFWKPEVYECWKIKASEDIYVNMRPLPNQFKDINNLDACKLPYHGVDMKISIVDRIKDYQYFYNIINFTIETLMRSDKGKKFFMNINAIPNDMGFDLNKWEEYLDLQSVIFYNPNENTLQPGVDANTVGKVVDLSLASDLDKYQQLAEYVRQMAGRVVGITDQMEGMMGQYEAVRNIQQSMIQTSHIIEIYFNEHNKFKKNVLTSLLESFKIAYTGKPNTVLAYVADDLSNELINVDTGLLESSTLGLFLENSAKTDEILQQLAQLAHASLQNQQINLSDYITLIEQESLVEATEMLKVAEEKKRKEVEQQQQSQQQHEKEMQDQLLQEKEKEHQRKIELLNLEYDRKEKLEVVKGSMLGASFNPDLDLNSNEDNDFLEMAKHNLDIKNSINKYDLDLRNLEHKKAIEQKKLEQEDRRLSQKDKEIELNRKKIANEAIKNRSK